jgi:hypothetical protein
MTTYYIDTEFNGLGGELLSMAIIGPTQNLYLVVPRPTEVLEQFVSEKVWPLRFYCPLNPIETPVSEWAQFIEAYLKQTARNGQVNIVADWPDDIRYFCETIITGPGTMIDSLDLNFTVARVDAYPNDIKDAVQHNAYWDAVALKKKIEG